MKDKCINCDSSLSCKNCGVCGECWGRKQHTLKHQIKMATTELKNSIPISAIEALIASLDWSREAVEMLDPKNEALTLIKGLERIIKEAKGDEQ